MTIVIYANPQSKYLAVIRTSELYAMKKRDTGFLQGIGQRIKKIRAEKEMTQYELAALCDFEKANMSRIESGQANSTILTLLKISKALDVHLSVLMKD